MSVFLEVEDRNGAKHYVNSTSIIQMAPKLVGPYAQDGYVMHLMDAPPIEIWKSQGDEVGRLLIEYGKESANA